MSAGRRGSVAGRLGLAALVVLANLAGNAVLNFGVKREAWAAIALGVALLIVWTLMRATLLSWADLTWVLPVTAFGYVLNVAAGALVFGEPVSAQRWGGAAMIALGAGLVAPAPKSAHGATARPAGRP